MAGVPQARDSRTARGNTSGARDGRTRAVAISYSGTRSVRESAPRNRMFLQSAYFCCRLGLRSPSPAISRSYWGNDENSSARETMPLDAVTRPAKRKQGREEGSIPLDLIGIFVNV